MNLESRVRYSPILFSPYGADWYFWLLIVDCISIFQMVASEDIGRQILTYGERFLYPYKTWTYSCISCLDGNDFLVMNSQCRKPIEHFLKMLDEITLKDIASLAEKLISSPLTMASWGDGMLNILLMLELSLILLVCL